MPISEMRPALGPGDYICSPSGLYFGILQSDGRFIIYRGGGPQEKGDALWSPSSNALQPGWDLHNLLIWGGPRKNGEWLDPSYLRIVTQAKDPPYRWGSLWKSPEWNAHEPCRAILTDEGNFCVYGTKSTDTLFWQSGVTDPVDRYDIAKLEYDLANAKTLSALSFTLGEQRLRNDTDEKQTTTISGSQSTTTTHSWTHQVGAKLGVKTTFETGIPVVFKGRVEVSAELSYAYTYGKVETGTQTFTWTAPVTVGPHGRAKLLVSATRSTIQVPYTMSGDVIYKSGKRVTKRLSGIYEGLNSHTVIITITPEGIDPTAAMHRSEVVPAEVTVKWGR